MKQLPLLTAMAMLGAAPLPAATVLFDFETDQELALWHHEGQPAGTPVKELARVAGFATSGRSALRFSSPKWKEGLARWPAFEGAPPIADWSGFDRLAFDVTNATEAEQLLGLLITDAKIATRDGLYRATHLPALSYTQVVVPLAEFAAKSVDPHNIARMHLFTSDVPADMALYLDHFVLLRPGEPPPAASPSYLKEFGALQAGRVRALTAALARARAELETRAAAVPEVARWVGGEVAALEQRVAQFAALVQRGDPEVLNAQRHLLGLGNLVERLGSVVDLRLAFEPVRQATRQGPAADRLAVGFATSMEKVLPRDVPVAARPAREVALSLAANEAESLQVVVLPFGGDVRQVSIRARGLRTRDGLVFPADRVTAVPVGYVETKSIPPYGTSHVGWWPDPILDFMPAADIAKGDAQAFWVRFRAPKEQPAGDYHGKLELLVEGQPALAFDLAVTVHPFAVPDGSPLPLAITFSPEHFPTDLTRAQQEEWRRSPDYPVNAWKRHKLEWADMLADHYLTYDSLYHHGVPDFEVLEHLRAEGRLGRFNLGYYGPMGETAEQQKQWEADTLPRLRQGYDEAKRRGMLGWAYIYGCDEAPADLFPTVQRAAERLKREFPGALIMTTTYDHTFGQESVIKAIDAWCPLTPSMNAPRADVARAAGREVWWYTCCGPHHPHLNTFIEYPAVEGRLLMGAATVRSRPDGYLYYQISIWNSEHCITSGPFTDWDPRSWTTYHGDGSWTCVGPDGTPLSTVRLENFRDGLEDYAYARVLEATLAKVQADPAARADRAEWIARAKALLAVPDEVLKGLTEYTHDPAAVYRWRDAMAEAIGTAGIKPVEPW